MTDVWSQTLNVIASLTSFPIPKPVAEPLLSWGEGGLVVSSLIVVIGLAAEYRLEKRKERWIPDLRPLKWDWRVIWGAVIVGGIAIEFVCDAAIWRASDSLQTLADREIEELRAQNNEMKAAFAWRNLDHDQQLKIAGAVRHFGAIPFDTAISNEPEALNLLNQIMVALDSGGWLKKHCNCAGPSLRDKEGRATSVTLLGQGVDILYDPSKAADFAPAAQALAKALNENGIKAVAAAAGAGELTADNIHVRVASKPR